MKKESKDKAGELSYKIAKALEALIKKDVHKAEELYHGINKGVKPEEKEILGNQVKRLGKEIKLCKKKLKEAKRKEIKAKTAVTGVLIIVFVYLFLKPGITGLYIAEPQDSAQLSSISDLHLEIGQEFSYRVYPDDASMENVVFSDDTRLFSISKDGIIRFTPTEEMRGIHYVAIIAKGPNGWFDLRILKFVIGEIIEEISVEEETIVSESNEPVDEMSHINESIEGIANETLVPINLSIELNETKINQTPYENLTNKTD
jgi:hypothetical protein